MWKKFQKMFVVYLKSAGGLKTKNKNKKKKKKSKKFVYKHHNLYQDTVASPYALWHHVISRRLVLVK